MKICSRCSERPTTPVYDPFCSSRCKTPRSVKICEGCGIEYMGMRGQRFHSQTCWIEWYNQTDSEHSSSGGNAVKKIHQKRWAEYDGPRRAYKKLDGRHVHRVAAESMLGRALHPGEVVHHKNEDKFDNSWFNLWVFPDQKSHMRDHGEHRRLYAPA